VALLAFAVTGLAAEQDVRVRADYLHLTAGEGQAPGQAVGYGLRARLEGLADLLDGTLEIHADGRAREDIERPEATRRSLAEARLSLRDAGPFTVDLGRIPFSEGTALLTIDGGAVAVRYAPELVHRLAGGLRGELDDLSPDRDRPAAATSLTLRLDRVDASASASWTRDRVAPSGREGDERQRDIVNAATRALVLPTEQVWLLVAGEVADVAAWAVPSQEPRTWELSEAGYAITQGYGQVGYRPWRPLRLDASYVFLASRFGTGGGTDRFQDVAARIRWRLFGTLRVMSRARLRFRDRVAVTGDGFDTVPDESLRLQAGLDLADVAGTGLALAGTAILDRGRRHETFAYTADVGHRGPWWSAFAGWRSTVRDTDDDFGTHAASTDVAALDPYSRTVQQAVNLRAGVNASAFDLHVSADRDLQTRQTLLFTQGSVRWR